MFLDRYLIPVSQSSTIGCMNNIPIRVIFIASILTAGGASCQVEKIEEPPEEVKSLELETVPKSIYEENFEAGMEGWELTDPQAWLLSAEEDGHVLALVKDSNYTPPVRSPANIALAKAKSPADYTLEVTMRSTTEEYNHRDLCLIFGWQSPSEFYYVHIATRSDPHANSIFLVNNKPRISIAEKRTEGTSWGEGAHQVRVVRKGQSGLIQIFFDNLEEPIMEAHDTTFGGGRFGVGSFDDEGTFDDIRLW